MKNDKFVFTMYAHDGHQYGIRCDSFVLENSQKIRRVVFFFFFATIKTQGTRGVTKE